MRAVVVKSFGGPETIEIAEVPVPVPAPGEVLIRTQAVSVHPADVAVRSGAVAAYLPEQPYYQLGWDVAGTVEAVGDGVQGFRAGDAVIGLSHWFATRNGTHADFAVLPAGAVAPAPAGTPVTAAATLPLNGLAALQAVEAAGLAEGGTLLVSGAAGSLGGFAAQLAVGRGLRVIAVAGAADREFLTGLGAQWVERGETAVEAVRALAPEGVDGVVDAAILGAPLLPAVRDGGAFVSVRPTAAPEPDRGIRVTVVDVHPDGAQLVLLATLVEQGRLTLRVDSEHPLTEAAKAHTRLAEGGVRGGVVLTTR